jgi:hypothetical protein
MWWKDSPNVLEDLDMFAALYIKVHGCVWSEYGLGVTYDDDNENHDGDENWYMTRVQPFRANAAFSLYGILRGSLSAGGCRRGTYINSFFTYMGADSILQALHKSPSTAFPDEAYGSAGCYQYYGDGNGRDLIWLRDYQELLDYTDGESLEDFERLLNNNNNNNNGNNNNQISTTMGCNLDGDFVVAEFAGADCDGKNVLNTTTSLPQYNRAIRNLGCQNIWKRRRDSRKNNGWNGTVAEKILSTSFACDIALYGDLCPDPYGLKHKYDANTKLSAMKGRSVTIGKWQGTLRLLSSLMLIAGLGLFLVGYLIRKPKALKRFKKRVREIVGKKKEGEPTSPTSLAGETTGTAGSKSVRSSKYVKSSKRTPPTQEQTPAATAEYQTTVETEESDNNNNNNNNNKGFFRNIKAALSRSKSSDGNIFPEPGGTMA